jgi:hypothetical protein
MFHHGGHTRQAKACRTCLWVRYFLILAAFLVIGLWSGTSLELPLGIDYNELTGHLFLASFLIVLAVKWWQSKRSNREGHRDDGLTWTGRSRRPDTRKSSRP